MSILRALRDWYASSRQPGGVSARWLLQSQSRLNRRFARRASVSVERRGDFDHVTINGATYAWPAGVPTNDLMVVVGELTLPHHAHQYLWGPTAELGRGDVVLDIGTCEGAFAAEAAARGAEVVCVEPSRVMAPVIGELFRLRGLAPPRIEEAVLGPEPGECRFRDNPAGPGSSRPAEGDGGYDVPVLTLDGLVKRCNLPRVDFIKCDAEGMDVGIIRGGVETLGTHRPRLAVTTYHNRGDFEALRDFLTGLGYRVRGKGILRMRSATHTEFRPNMIHAW